MAYYHSVRDLLGREATDRFVRLFLVPGVGHCEGGDGYDQFDVLRPLMVWTERGEAPTQIMTGRAEKLPAGAETSNDANTAPPAPFATPMPTLAATRPVFPFPYLARYTNKGDSNDGTNYSSVPGPPHPADAGSYEATRLFQPDNQKQYAVNAGKLVIPVGLQ